MSNRDRLCIDTSSKWFINLSKNLDIYSGDLEQALRTLPEAGSSMPINEVESYIMKYFKVGTSIPFNDRDLYNKAIQIYNLYYNPSLPIDTETKAIALYNEASSAFGTENVRMYRDSSEKWKVRVSTPVYSNDNSSIIKVISGGQTGVDTIGLQVAKELGIETGGTAPKGFLRERGIYNENISSYNLVEITDEEQADYTKRKGKTDPYTGRTELNVRNSDGTVYFYTSDDKSGMLATKRSANDWNKPFITNPTAEQLKKWIKTNNIKVLNVAGNRGSKLSKDNNVAEVLREALSETLNSPEAQTVDKEKLYTEVESFKDGRLASTDSQGNISIRKNFSLEEFFDYVSGKVESITSAQKKEMFRQLETWKAELDNGEVIDLGVSTLKRIIKTVEDAKKFLYLHEKSHREHNDKDVYFVNGKDFMTQDKIDIEARATRDAYNEFLGNVTRIFNPFLEAQALVDRIKRDSIEHITFDPESHTYYRDGQKIDISVTQLIHKNDNIPEAWKIPSDSIGSALDKAVRLYFQGKDITAENIPNMSDKDLINLKEDLDRLKGYLDKVFEGKQYKVVTDEFPITGVYNYIENGKSKSMTVAGTMDMLIYDSDGNFYIYDIKTKRINTSVSWYQSTETGYFKQLSMYKAILEASYPELKGKIKNMKLLRFDTIYPAPIGEGIDNGEVSYFTDKGQLYVEEDLFYIMIQDYNEYSAPRLSVHSDNGLFDVKVQDIEGEFSSYDSLSEEHKELLSNEFADAEVQDKIPEQSEESRQVMSLYSQGTIPASERMFLGNSVMYYASFIISQLQNSSDANEAYFGDKYSGVDFTGMSRRELIDFIGIPTILNYVREAYFNPENRDDLDDFDVIDKLQVAYDNWGALVQSAYSKLITLEDTTVIPSAPENIRKEDLLEGNDDTVEGATLEEKEREYWQIGQRQVSARASLSMEIKRAFERMLVTDTNGNYVMDKYGYGLMTFVDSGMAINKILDWVNACTSIIEMEQILKEMAPTNPWLNGILDKIKEEPFRSMFYQNFRKQHTKYSIITVDKNPDGTREYSVQIINTKEALKALLENVTESYNSGSMKNIIVPLKGSLDGKGQVNSSSVQSIKDYAIEAIRKIRKAHNKGMAERAISNEIPKLAEILKSLGIITDTKVLTETFMHDSKRKNIENTNIFNMLQEIVYMTDTLLENKDKLGYNPVEKGAEGNIYGNYKNIIERMSKFIQDSIESSTYENGKMYYSFVNPSYMGKLVNNLKDSLDNPVKFNNFMQQEYGRFRFFKDGETWKNVWLEKLYSSKEARQNFDYKVQLSYNGTGYTELSELGYTLSLMQEYFYDKNKKLAWYRIPILANKPSSEFVRFTRYSGRDYKRYIKNDLKKVCDQEIMRIKTVLERGVNPDINKIGVKDKITFDLKDSMITEGLKEKIETHSLTLKDFVKDGKSVFKGSGAEFKFLDALNDEIINGTALGQMIIDKINGKEINETEFNMKFNETIDSYMNIIVENQKNEWKNIGLYDVEEKKITRTDKSGKVIEETRSYYKYINNLGNSVEQIENSLEEYIWNDMFATINIIELTATDLAYYKNVEDFQKRYAQIHAPAMKLNTEATVLAGSRYSANGRYSADGKERTIYLKDCIVKSDIVNNVRIAFDNKIAQLSGVEKAHMQMMKDLIISQFEGINVADAQGYSSPTSYRKKMGMMGRWNEEMEEAYERIVKGNYNLNDLNVVWQPLKPFVYSQIPKSSGASTMTELKVPVQNKNSEYMLLIADALMRGDNQKNKLIAIFDFMEDSAYDGRVSENGKVIKEGTYNGIGIDTVQFESAVNSGSMGSIDINQLETYEEVKEALNKAVYYNTDKSETSDNAMDRYNDQFVHTISYEDYGIQQEVPAHLVDHQQLMGSQIRILSISDITPGTIFEVDGKQMSGEELTNEYQNLIAKNIRNSFDNLIKEFNLKGTRKQKNKAISNLLIRTILEDQRYGSDLLRACTLNEEGEFVIPLSDPIQSVRIQQLLNSIIKNRINKQKVKGGPVVQASVFGMSDDLHIVFDEKDKGKVKYFECYMPIPSKELEEALTKPDGSLMTIEEAIKAGIMTEEMRKAIGYRIPTEDKYSMAPLMIKGFLPKAAGEAIMLPKEITKLSGSDFDIDKMYVMLKNFMVSKESIDVAGFISSIRAFLEEKGCSKEYIENFIQGNIKKGGTESSVMEYIKKIEKGVSFGTDKNLKKEWAEDKKGILIYDAYIANKDKFKVNKKFIESKNLEEKEGIDNRIFDLQWAVLTNSDTAVKMFNPGSFDNPKKSARIINILKNSEKKYSYEELSKKSLKELEELAESSSRRNIIFSGTQVYFHKQNMTAGKLIGVFANNNTSHAFLSMQDIRLNLFEGEGFMFDGVLINSNRNNKLDALYGKNGALISKTIAEFLAASVDAVKDPVLNHMNLNTFTANTAMLLARLGFDSDSIGLFLTQPAIEAVTREYFKRSNEGYVTTGIIDEYLPDDTDLVKSIERSLESTPFSKEDLAAGISKGSVDTDFQKSVLVLFKKLSGISQDLNTLTFLTKFNSVTNAVGPTIADTLVMRERYRKFLDKMESNPPFNEDAAKVIENSPILNAFYSTTVADEGASSLIFREYFPHYGDMFTLVLDKLRQSIKGQLDAKLINKLVNDFMVYKMTLGPGPVIDGSMENRTRFVNFVADYLTNSKGIIDNELLNIIKVKGASSRCPVPVLEAKTGGYSMDLQEKIKSGWSDLVLNPNTKSFGVDLFFYNIFRNGFGYSPKTFGHLASVDVKTNIPGYVDSLRDIRFNENNVSVMDFLYQFLRNHTQEYKLVPRFTENDKVKVSKEKNVKGDNLITFVYDNNKSGMNSIVVEDSLRGTVYAPVIMYEDKVYMNPVIRGNSVTYTETTTLGNSNNFLEYGPEGAFMETVINKAASPERENPGYEPKKDTIEDLEYKLDSMINTADKGYWEELRKIVESEYNDYGKSKALENITDEVASALNADNSFKTVIRNKILDKLKNVC